MTAFKKYILNEITVAKDPALKLNKGKEGKEGKDFLTLVDSAAIRTVQLLTYKGVKAVFKGKLPVNVLYFLSDASVFNETKKENAIVFSFCNDGRIYCLFDHTLWIWSDINKLLKSSHEFADVVDFADSFPAIKTAYDHVAPQPNSVMSLPLKNNVDDEMVSRLEINWKSYWSAILWYILKKNGHIGKMLQAVLIKDSTNIGKVFGWSASSGKSHKDSFKNGIIGKLIDWDISIIIDKICKTPYYSVDDILGTRIIDEFAKFEDVKELFDRIAKDDDYSMTNKFNSAFTNMIKAKKIKTTDEFNTILSLVPVNKIDKVITSQNLIEVFDKLSDQMKERLVIVHHKYVLDNKDKFPSKWVERAHWKRKQKYDIKY